MPVVVTGASGFVGPHAVRAFSGASPEVRAYVRRREAGEALRALGAKVAVGWIGDVENLAAVMDGAHTVCHLIGPRTRPDERSVADSTTGALRPVLQAAGMAGVQRFLMLSFPGAVREANNHTLRLAAEAEELVAASGIPFVVVRSTWIYGDGAPLSRRSVPSVARRLEWAPVHVEDVAAVLAAADDRRTLRSGVFGLEGPDRLPAGEFLDRFERAEGAPGRGRWLGRPTRPLPTLAPSIAALLGWANRADGPDAAEEFGVTTTPLAVGLQRVAGARTGRETGRA